MAKSITQLVPDFREAGRGCAVATSVVRDLQVAGRIDRLL